MTTDDHEATSDATDGDTEGHAKKFFARPEDDAPEKDAASADEESAEEQDVKGPHSRF